MGRSIKKDFSVALSYSLKQKGWGAQSALARKINKEQSFISALAKGKKYGSEETRRAVASHFGYRYEAFLELGQALIKADELGGRHILFRAGLKYLIDGMSLEQRTDLISRISIDSGKVEDFLDGRDTLTEDEQRQICVAFAKGSYEDFLHIGLTTVQMGLKPDEDGDAYEALKPENKPKLNLINGGEKGRRIDPATATHDEIITQFKHKEWVRRISFMLLEIEGDPVHRETVERVVKAIADQIRAKQDKVNND